ncbi:angio-associated migratory cell protein isoform X2 [Phlebotomus papatasi]|uniref:angio-associated migratory cell protein isoform X2 n=1 Tax=Phlebotomus papatasi TaxID=29031 RepID=UPI0024837AF0|nr:angio-associated migratory cell protein isoform X2 [Phlebotomus papatasi]
MRSGNIPAVRFCCLDTSAPVGILSKFMRSSTCVRKETNKMGSHNSPNRPPPREDNFDEELFEDNGMDGHNFDRDDDFPDEFVHVEEILDDDDAERMDNDMESDEEGAAGSESQDNEETEPIRDDAVLTFKEHSGPVFCGSFHPTEPLAVTGSEDDTAYVWKTSTGEVVFKSDGHSDTIIAASFSYDGSYLATGDLGGFLQVFRLSEAFKRVWHFNIGDMTWMEWHRASNVLMAGSESGEVYFWRIPSGDCKVLQGHNSKAECASLTADAKKIAVGYADGSVTLWDIKTTTSVLGIPPNSPHGHTEGVLSVSTDPEGSLFVSGGSDGLLVISSSAGPLGRIDVRDPVETVAFSPATDALKLVATGTLQGKITIWDISRQSPRCECKDDELSGVTKVLWTRDLTLLAATLDGSVKVFEGRTGQLKSTLLGHRREIYDIQMHKNGELLLTTSEDGTAKIFHLLS